MFPGLPSATISEATWRETVKVPIRLTRTTASNSDCASVSKGPKRTIPALLTSKSGVEPNCFIAFSTEFTSETSAEIATQFFGNFSSRSTSATFRSRIPTCQPSDAS